MTSLSLRVDSGAFGRSCFPFSHSSMSQWTVIKNVLRAEMDLK